MSTLELVLLVIAAVLMGLRAFGIGHEARWHLGWLGAAVAVLAIILG